METTPCTPGNLPYTQPPLLNKPTKVARKLDVYTQDLTKSLHERQATETYIKKTVFAAQGYEAMLGNHPFNYGIARFKERLNILHKYNEHTPFHERVEELLFEMLNQVANKELYAQPEVRTKLGYGYRRKTYCPIIRFLGSLSTYPTLMYDSPAALSFVYTIAKKHCTISKYHFGDSSFKEIRTIMLYLDRMKPDLIQQSGILKLLHEQIESIPVYPLNNEEKYKHIYHKFKASVCLLDKIQLFLQLPRVTSSDQHTLHTVTAKMERAIFIPENAEKLWQFFSNPQEKFSHIADIYTLSSGFWSREQQNEAKTILLKRAVDHIASFYLSFPENFHKITEFDMYPGSPSMNILSIFSDEIVKNLPNQNLKVPASLLSTLKMYTIQLLSQDEANHQQLAPFIKNFLKDITTIPHTGDYRHYIQMLKALEPFPEYTDFINKKAIEWLKVVILFSDIEDLMSLLMESIETSHKIEALNHYISRIIEKFARGDKASIFDTMENNFILRLSEWLSLIPLSAEKDALTKTHALEIKKYLEQHIESHKQEQKIARKKGDMRSCLSLGYPEIPVAIWLSLEGVTDEILETNRKLLAYTDCFDSILYHQALLSARSLQSTEAVGRFLSAHNPRQQITLSEDETQEIQQLIIAAFEKQTAPPRISMHFRRSLLRDFFKAKDQLPIEATLEHLMKTILWSTPDNIERIDLAHEFVKHKLYTETAATYLDTVIKRPEGLKSENSYRDLRSDAFEVFHELMKI